MERSKCVICGKVRMRKFLIKFNDLSGNNIWVCNRKVGYNYDYVKIGNNSHIISKCQISYLNMMNKIIEDNIKNYEECKKKLRIYKYLIDEIDNKNVSPELTFLLQ